MPRSVQSLLDEAINIYPQDNYIIATFHYIQLEVSALQYLFQLLMRDESLMLLLKVLDFLLSRECSPIPSSNGTTAAIKTLLKVLGSKPDKVVPSAPVISRSDSSSADWSCPACTTEVRFYR